MTSPTPSASWLSEAGLGIFLHWNHSSTRGWEISWQMTGGVRGQEPPREPVPVQEYFDNAHSFNPAGFDADAWAAAIASAGARYAVFTAKHHDGFAMFDSGLSDYSVVRESAFGRDIVAELFPALRRAGLRVGVYFSIVDWHHPDYPRFSDDAITKPYTVGVYPRPTAEQWARYRAFMLGQLSELLTNYGPVDVVWLDGEFEHTLDEWDFEGIRAHIRALAPGALVNDRCLGYGDFATPELQLPPTPPLGPWEMNLTLNESWSYVPADRAWKSAAYLIEQLVETVSAGGTLLLNVGPRGDGTFPPEATDRLQALGRWVAMHEEAVRGVHASGLTRWQMRLPTSARRTEDGGRLYIYCTLAPRDTLVVRDVNVRRVQRVHLLGHSEPLAWGISPSIAEVRSGTDDPLGELTIHLAGLDSADLCPVIVIDMADAPLR